MQHFQEDDKWKQNSLIAMKTPQDWRPVWVGLGILALFIGAAFVRYYLEKRQLAHYELELS